MKINTVAFLIRASMACAGLTCMLAAGAAQAQGQLPLRATDDDAELARGAVPDTTAGQRHNTAVREAYGAQKNNLAECRNAPAAERKTCQADAQAQFKADMALANQIKADPRARPVKVKGGYPRKTSETTIIEMRK